MMNINFNGTKKYMIIMLIGVGLLFGSIFTYKGIVGLLKQHFFATQKSPLVTVSTIHVTTSSWQQKLKSVGSVDSILGVNVTAELGGMIQTIYFTSGAVVQKGTLLVQQNADPNIASLHSLEANAELARITDERDKAQYKIHAVSKQQLDSDEQNLKSLRAQVDQQAAIVEQLMIKAPFTGRLGISQVNPGQYLNPGDAVVTLQSLDPIYVNFYLPQQTLSQLKIGQDVNVTVDTFLDKTFAGKITTINPIVETNTRNVEVQATLPNPQNELLPGMFTHVEVITQTAINYLTLPQTAVSFNPYGDIVYLVQKSDHDEKGNPILTAHQIFVTTGETRGDQVAILKGLHEGDEVVTSGQLKLKNGSRIAINNTVQPDNHSSSLVSNEHEG